MARQLRFALNHIVAPHAGVEAFFALAARLGIEAVEIRNDLEGVAIADGTDAATVRAAADKHGMRILSINALQRFNEWTAERAVEATALADYARTCGAEALVSLSRQRRRGPARRAARIDGLRAALRR